MDARTPSRRLLGISLLLVTVAALAVAGQVTANHLSIDKVAYLDQDMDGLIDSAAIVMSSGDNVDPSSIRPGDFTFKATQPSTVTRQAMKFGLNDAGQFDPAICPNVSPDGNADNIPDGITDCFIVAFEEHQHWTTGGLISTPGKWPDMTFDGRVLFVPGVPPAGETQFVPDITIVGTSASKVLDGAGPALVGVGAATGQTFVTTMWSEPIPAGTTPMATSVFTHFDSNGNGQTLTGSMSDTRPGTTIKADPRVLYANIAGNVIAAGDLNADTLTTNAGGAIVDSAGLDAAGGIAKAFVYPQIVSAVANENAKEIVVTFNVPVQNEFGGVLNTGSFYTPPNGIDPSGAIDGFNSVDHRLGSNVAVLKIHNGHVNVADLDSSKIRPRDDKIAAFGQPANTMSRGPGPYDAVITESIAPKLTQARAYDTNKNGLLDVVELVFSEKLDDASGDNLVSAHWKLIAGDRGGADDIVAGGSNGLTVRSGGPGDTCGTGMSGASNDNKLLICWNEATLDKNGVCKVDGLCMGTGVQLSIDYTPSGANRVKDAAGNQLPTYEGFAVDDMAPPILMRAQTLDTQSTPTTKGRIDAYKLTWSETLDSGTAKIDGWTIEDHSIPSGGVTVTGSIANFEFNEIAEGYDTGALPELTYTPPSNGWKDLHGNKVAAITAAMVKEQDGARPLLVKVESEEGLDKLTLYFSEGVKHTSDLKLDTSVFEYLNLGSGTVSAPKAGAGSFQHTKGADTATWLLNGPMAPGDFNDRVQVLASSGNALTSDIIEGLATDLAPNTLNSVQPKEYSITRKPVPPADTIAPSTPGALTLKAGSPDHSTVIIEFAESTDAESTVSYSVYYDTAAVTQANYKTATKGSSTVATDAGTVTMTVTGLTGDTEYFFCVVAQDEAANPSATSCNSNGFTTAKKPVDPSNPNSDTTAPDAIDKLEIVAVLANAFGIQFKEPADDGKITGYNLKLSSTSFSTYQGAKDDLPDGVTASVSPKESDGTVTITVVGLDPKTTYYVSVRAKDAGGNVGDASPVESATTKDDTTAPPTPAGLSLTPSSNIREGMTVTVSWEEVKDSESAVTKYLYAVNTDPEYEFTGEETQSVTQTRVDVKNLAKGDNWFHVAAVSAGPTPSDPAGRIKITVKGNAPDIENAAIVKFNDNVDESAKKTAAGIEVRWTLPANPPAEVAGVQIWCVGATSSSLVKNVAAGTKAFTDGVYVDTGVPCDGKYLVNAYYEGDLGFATDSSDLDGVVTDTQEAGVSVDKGGALPTWLWMVLAAVGVLILVAVVVVVIMKGRGKSGSAGGDASWGDVDETGDAADSWDAGSSDEPSWGDETGGDEGGDDQWADEGGNDVADEPSWADEPGDEPAFADAPAAAGSMAASGPDADVEAEADIHQVTCPECNDVFVAEGIKPLKIECPSCGVQGMLN